MRTKRDGDSGAALSGAFLAALVTLLAPPAFALVGVGLGLLGTLIAVTFGEPGLDDTSPPGESEVDMVYTVAGAVGAAVGFLIGVGVAWVQWAKWFDAKRRVALQRVRRHSR